MICSDHFETTPLHIHFFLISLQITVISVRMITLFLVLSADRMVAAASCNCRHADRVPDVIRFRQPVPRLGFL